MRKTFALVAAIACLFISGCVTEKGSPALAADPKDSGKAASSALHGRWKGKIEMPKTDKNDPSAAFAEGLANTMLSMMELRFLEDDRFRMTVFVFPIEGKVTRDGNKITLTPETVAGLTPEEARKHDASLQTPELNKPFSGTISEDGKRITLASDKPEEGTMIFEPAPADDHKLGPESVTPAEKELVGTYSAKAKSPAPKTPKEEMELRMMQSMAEGFELELRSDNTYRFLFMMEMKGTWKLDGDQVKLTMSSDKSLGEGVTSNVNFETVRLLPDKSLLMKGGKEGDLVFSKT